MRIPLAARGESGPAALCMVASVALLLASIFAGMRLFRVILS